MRLVALTAALLVGCSDTPEFDWSPLDEVDWDAVEPEPAVVTYPTVDNRLHLLRIGRDTVGTLSYWDGLQWVDTDTRVIIPEGWFVGPDICCDAEEEMWEEQDRLETETTEEGNG